MTYHVEGAAWGLFGYARQIESRKVRKIIQSPFMASFSIYDTNRSQHPRGELIEHPARDVGEVLPRSFFGERYAVDFIERETEHEPFFEPVFCSFSAKPRQDQKVLFGQCL